MLGNEGKSKLTLEDDAATWLLGVTGECNRVSHFDFDGWRVDVRTNSDALKRSLDDYFEYFRAEGATSPLYTVMAWQGQVPEFEGDWVVKQPEPGKQRIKEHVGDFPGGRLIRKVQTGVHLGYAGSERICCGPLSVNDNQVVNFINNIYLDDLLRDDGQLFHAAGVCDGRVGVGLAGWSGKGKSTLALRLLEHGMDLVSNDRLVVTLADPPCMYGIAKYPRINPGTIVNQAALLKLASAKDIARYREMPSAQLWDLEEKYDAFVEQSFPGCRFRLSARMEMFVILDWDRNDDGPCNLRRVSAQRAGSLVDTVMKSPGVMLPGASARIPVAHREDYIALLDHTALFVLTGGVDFDAAADAIRDQVTRLT